MQHNLYYNMNFFSHEMTSFYYALNNGLLYVNGACESTENCKGKYYMVKDKYAETGYRLQCSHCHCTKSIFFKSIFTRSKLPMTTVFHILYCWANKYRRGLAAHECCVSKQTITNFYQSFRLACMHRLHVHPQQPIGGPGTVVEIDESVMTKRMYNRGRKMSEIWLFGGICRQTGERFIFQVPERSADYLIPLIQVYIKPGTTIHSDGWAAYNEIKNLPQNYNHLIVNHSENFVDPETGCHTQSVERMWREVKRVKRIMEGINPIDIDGYIAEYLWRKHEEVNYSNGFNKAVMLLYGCPFY